MSNQINFFSMNHHFSRVYSKRWKMSLFFQTMSSLLTFKKLMFIKTFPIKNRATENQGRDAVHFHSWLKFIYEKAVVNGKIRHVLENVQKTQRKLLVKRKMEIFPKAITTEESHVATDLDHMWHATNYFCPCLC